MRTTHGATAPAANRHRDERGIIALEWLLIVGAIAGLAASSVLIVQRVVDDTSEVPVDPLVLVLEADIAAAFVVADADTAALSSPYTGSTRFVGQGACFVWRGPLCHAQRYRTRSR